MAAHLRGVPHHQLDGGGGGLEELDGLLVVLPLHAHLGEAAACTRAASWAGPGAPGDLARPDIPANPSMSEHTEAPPRPHQATTRRFRL